MLVLLGYRHASAQPGAGQGKKDAAAAADTKPAPLESVPQKTVMRLPPPLTFDRLGYADGLPNQHVGAIVQDRNGFIWFGTQDGLARYDGIKMQIYRHDDSPGSLSGTYVTALALDANGKMWVGTAENGVNLYDPDTDKFTRYGVTPGKKGGLSSAGVTAIVRDKKDRVWFAMTGGGLNRFQPDGTFAEYLTDPLDSTITAIASDTSGNLWLGTVDKGVIEWNPDNGSTAVYPPEPEKGGLGASGITSMLVTADGKVWIGTDGDGLFTLDPATRKLVNRRHVLNDPKSISEDHITVQFEDKKQNLWIGTAEGLNRIDRAGNVLQYHHDPNDPTSLANPGVESIYQDAGGIMYVGGLLGGVSKFDEGRAAFGHYRTRTVSANSYHEDPDGSVWVGTYHGGLYHYDWDSQLVTLFHSLGPVGAQGSIALESSWISAVLRDRRKTLWISLLGQGLIAFDDKAGTWKQYLPNPDKPNSLPVDTIWDVWEDAQGIFWLATWGGGLVRFDPQTDVFTSIPIGDANHLYQLYPDPTEKQILWIGAAKGGLIRFDTGTRTATAFRHKNEDPASLSSDDVLSIYREPSGAIWVGTYGGGLNKLDPATGKAQRFTTVNSKLTNDVIYGILPDDTGHLWLSTNGGGLLQVDPKSGEVMVWGSSDGVQGNEFGQGSYMRSKSGKLFFGGVNGFNAFFPKDIKRDTYVPPLIVTNLKVFNHEVSLERPIWTLPPLEMSYSDSFELQFAALSFAAPKENRYAYKLEGFDADFITTDRPYATYTKLDGGNYTLRIKAANRHGVWNEVPIALKISVTPPLWRTWPAYIVYVLLLVGAAGLLFYFQRQRVRRVEREGRLAVIERDLALTGAVQSGFLPNYNEIKNGSVQLYGFYRAADACSGDWWWHETVSGRHVILVGDVTGHGPGPAMVTAAVATAFRVLTVNGGLEDVKHGLEVLNNVVLHVAKGKYHMTMAAFELDERTGRWVLHSAGAPPIISLGQTGKHRVHFCAGTPLGIEAEFEPGRVEGQLEPAERILICTDGIPEIVLPNGSNLGMRRLAQIYERTRGQALKDAAAAIIQHADATQSGKPQDDDWTFTLIEWNGGDGRTRAY
ncbi:MAG TPA: two-component regulator propeller domain-containing protein [Kofleriaceae bacterium]|nr:two-component regulator propeller domain-containing protein [Kofleriaceae bacterium]